MADFAASFFLLAGSLKDAVNVCLRQLDDFQLAIAITRVHEGENPDGSIGPVLKFILEDFVLPIAFERGFRWLAGWAFWRLNRRDLSIRVIVVRFILSILQLSIQEDLLILPCFHRLR